MQQLHKVSGPHPFKSGQVLIVDDDIEVLEYFQQIIAGRAAGYVPEEVVELDSLICLLDEKGMGLRDSNGPDFQVDYVESGELAVEKITGSLKKGSPYAVVVLDMRMPGGMDGLETVEAIREIDGDINVILVSAFMDYSLDELRSKIGFDFSFIHKPIDSEGFIQSLYFHVNKWHESKKLTATKNALENYQQQLNLTLLLEKEHKEMMIHSMKDAVVWISRDGYIQQVNPKLEIMVGQTERELAGQLFSRLFVDNAEGEGEDQGIDHLLTKSTLFQEHIKQSRHPLEYWLETSLLATMMVDSNGEIIMVNHAMEELSGWDSAELTRSSVELLLPESMRGEHAKKVKQFISNPTFRQMGGAQLFPMMNGGGELVQVEIALLPLEIGQEHLVMVVMHDPLQSHRLEIFKTTPFGELFNEEHNRGEFKLKSNSYGKIPVEVTALPLYSEKKSAKIFTGAIMLIHNLNED